MDLDGDTIVRISVGTGLAIAAAIWRVVKAITSWMAANDQRIDAAVRASADMRRDLDVLTGQLAAKADARTIDRTLSSMRRHLDDLASTCAGRGDYHREVDHDHDVRLSLLEQAAGIPQRERSDRTPVRSIIAPRRPPSEPSDSG